MARRRKGNPRNRRGLRVHGRARQRKLPCHVCKSILRAFSLPPYTEVNLGAVKDILSIECGIHRSLLLIVFPSFSRYFPVVDNCQWDDEAVQRSIHLRITTDKRIDFLLQMDQSLLIYEEMMLSNKNRIIACRGFGEVVDPEWIDIRVIRDWMSTCERYHGNSCRRTYNATTIAQHHPNMLIDTWRKCLTKTTTVEPYVALSYVWGNATNLKTLQANVQDFQTAGSLGREDIACRIPRCIQDAIALTELLHQRYLWVDSLCIVQDDEKTSHCEITRMASIYANATLTIVAAGGNDANYGLRGIRGVSHPRSHRQQVAQLSNGARILKYYPPELSQAEWSQRGWTFQENLLSQRKLIFYDDSVMWNCSCDEWHEHVGSIHRKDTHRPLLKVSNLHAPGLFNSTWPDLLSYQRLVIDFNERSLTYPEDVVDAFSGVTTQLSAIFLGGFLYGIPTMFFDVALLWRASSTLERRIPRRKTGSEANLPSWSWMGWQGFIDSSSWNPGDDYRKPVRTDVFATSVRIIPLVHWNAHNKDRRSARQVISTWSKYRNCIYHDYSHKEVKVPLGWERYSYCSEFPFPDEFKRHFPDHNVPQYFYKHNSDETAEFWYPIPMREAAQEQIALDKFPLISCRTTRCWLDAAVNNLDHARLWLSLRDGAGILAGMLSIHRPYGSGLGLNTPVGPCELISISKGYARGGSGYDISLLERFTTLFPKCYEERYEFYNVLWIEWEDGIAFRKGVGRVEKSMWEAQPLEWIDVTLG
jgi:hypothetical protein